MLDRLFVPFTKWTGYRYWRERFASSGGERQKLGLAQGLLRNCKIILLDEVTSNVDKNSEEEIKNILLRLKEENGLTLISISHRMDFLKDTDRIVVLENGQIKETTSYCDYIGN